MSDGSAIKVATIGKKKKIGSPCFIIILVLISLIVIAFLILSYTSERCRFPDGPCDLRWNSSLYK